MPPESEQRIPNSNDTSGASIWAYIIGAGAAIAFFGAALRGFTFGTLVYEWWAVFAIGCFIAFLGAVGWLYDREPALRRAMRVAASLISPDISFAELSVWAYVMASGVVIAAFGLILQAFTFSTLQYEWWAVFGLGVFVFFIGMVGQLVSTPLFRPLGEAIVNGLWPLVSGPHSLHVTANAWLENVVNGLPALLHIRVTAVNRSSRPNRIEHITVTAPSPWNVSHTVRPLAHPKPHRFVVPAGGQTAIDITMQLAFRRVTQSPPTNAEITVSSYGGQRERILLGLPALPVSVEQAAALSEAPPETEAATVSTAGHAAQ